MFSRLNTCIYGLDICIYSDSYPFTSTKLHIFIYMQCVTQFTMYKPLILQEFTVSMIQKQDRVLQKPL